jgi:hypothetical protein
VLEVENQLRALLRDVLCGYLDPDLKSAADDILLRSAEPFEVEARDLRRFRRSTPPEAEVPETRAQESGPESQPSAEPDAAVEPDAPVEQNAPTDEELAEGVTPSADWGFDEDPESYSAPV